MGRNTRIIIPATGVEYRKMKFMIYDVVHRTPEYPLQKGARYRLDLFAVSFVPYPGFSRRRNGAVCLLLVIEESTFIPILQFQCLLYPYCMQLLTGDCLNDPVPLLGLALTMLLFLPTPRSSPCMDVTSLGLAPSIRFTKP